MYKVYRNIRRFRFLLLASFILCCTISILPTGHSALLRAQSVPVGETKVQQGIERYEAGQFNEAITIWQQALPEISATKDRAVVHTNLAQGYRQTGQLSEAIAHWKQAIEIYQRQDDAATKRQLPKLLTEQGQAYSDLGQHGRAIKILQSAVAMARKYQDSATEAAALGALGNARWALGDYDQALATLQKSLQIARQLHELKYVTSALNNLGNVYTSRSERYRYQASLADLEGDTTEEARLTQLTQQDTTAAVEAFEQSVRESQAVGGMTEVEALLNLNRLQSQLPSANAAVIAQNRERASVLLEQAPDSRDKAYALINLALSTQGETPRTPTALIKAVAVAKNIKDDRALSFALGSLGQVYELSGQYDKAMELTRQAEEAAQQANAADSLYRWQWQAGRLFKAGGEKNSAIASYEQAIATLQQIRGDLIAASKDLQFDFRDSVEPVYRELMALLLEPSATKETRAKNLEKVINNLELLKLAELQNFFGDECVQVARDQREGETSLVDSKAAVIYSVILDDRSELLLRLPNGHTTSYQVAIGRKQMQQEVEILRQLLEKRSTEQYLAPAQHFYNALIRPMEADLAAAKPTVLVFINDGVLRQVPMAALYDGQQFLIQKYAIATTPSLSLTTSKPLIRTNLRALILGLTVERAPFAALTNVQAEVKQVREILGGTELLDQDFTLQSLQAQLQKQSYPVVHMATHGKFGVDANSTYLVGFDTRITLEQIDNLLRSRHHQEPVELLTLSACQTAAGDNRAALGIAGVAVRAGVKSAVASLWYIYDEATVPLITEFYTQLRQSDITKAEALRRAQLKLIANEDYNHPAVWSPFILIGNWL